MVVQKAMPIEVKVIGTAEPHSTVAVRAQVTGQLIAVNFREGRRRQEGPGLVRAGSASARIGAAAGAGQPCAGHRAADETQKRRPSVFRTSPSAALPRRSSSTRSRTGVAALAATVEADRAAVENAQVQLQCATITAPISGRTGTLMVHEGNLRAPTIRRRS